ncbi:hypothetical protein KUCAC02_036949 [Chaenocephalus aceratus]|nr:hypothetical protein KUCAC02_036949 [Chaenocephalus aceratus]
MIVFAPWRMKACGFFAAGTSVSRETMTGGKRGKVCVEAEISELIPYLSLENLRDLMDVSLDLMDVSLDLMDVSLDLMDVSLDLMAVSLDLMDVSLDLMDVSLDLMDVSLDLMDVSLDLMDVSLDPSVQNQPT